jgi:hypothetical protein
VIAEKNFADPFSEGKTHPCSMSNGSQAKPNPYEMGSKISYPGILLGKISIK